MILDNQLAQINLVLIQSEIQLSPTSPSPELIIFIVYALISDRKSLSDDFPRGQ
jgi:hypothetical protein